MMRGVLVVFLYVMMMFYDLLIGLRLMFVLVGFMLLVFWVMVVFLFSLFLGSVVVVYCLSDDVLLGRLVLGVGVDGESVGVDVVDVGDDVFLGVVGVLEVYLVSVSRVGISRMGRVVRVGWVDFMVAPYARLLKDVWIFFGFGFWFLVVCGYLCVFVDV